MKHGTRHWEKKLGRSPEHRRDLLRNLLTSLVTHQQITTTTAKAKFMQRQADILIQQAKLGNMDMLKNNLFKHSETIPILMNTLLPRYKNTNGGFTRIILNGNRSSGSDRANLAIVELINNPKDTIYHLAKHQMPTVEKSFDLLLQEKYNANTLELLDPVSGKPTTITQYSTNTALHPKQIMRLNKKEVGMKKVMKKYERSLNTYPIARSLESSSTEESQTDITISQSEPTEEKQPEKKERKNALSNLFKRLGF